MVDPAQEERPVVLNSNGLAVVRWVSDENTLSLGLQPFAKVHFHLHFDSVSKKAFFKLRIPITLESLFDTPTPLFIFIHPERIESLAQIEDVTSGGPLNHLLKSRQSTGSQVHVRFTLSRPADLVLPKTVAGKAFCDATARAQAALEKCTEQQNMHGDSSTHAAHLLMLLARASAFDVHVHLPNVKEDLPANMIPAICEAASGRTLSSNTTASDLVSLYGGKGAQVLELSDIISDTQSYTESPPAYNEAASIAPTAAETASAGASSNSALKKRRRSSSPRESLPEKPGHSIEDVFSKLFQGAMLAMEARLENRMQNWVEDCLKQQAEETRNAEIRMKEWLEDRLQQQADRIERLADEQDQMMNHFDDEIQQVRNETDDLCDVRIDDQMLSVKVECEEFVKDEMREAKRGIVQHFRSMANLFSDIDSELGDIG